MNEPQPPQNPDTKWLERELNSTINDTLQTMVDEIAKRREADPCQKPRSLTPSLERLLRRLEEV